MTIQEYITLARRTESVADFPNSRLLHAALGLATEAIELLNANDIENQIEELGDLCWYAAIAYDAMSSTAKPEGNYTRRPQLAAMAEELASGIKAHVWYKRPLDKVAHLPAQILADAHATYAYVSNPPGDIFDLNIAKLKARYPERFTTEAANNRNLHTEANALRAQILAGATPTKSV